MLSGHAHGRDGEGELCGRGFTLFEMLVVMGMITILTGLLLPTLQGVRAEARSVTCLSNLKQAFGVIEIYRQQHNNNIPNCEPLPAVTPDGPVGGLNEALASYVDSKCECWICGADFSGESEEIGTSYFYTPGLLILSPLVQIQMPVNAFELNEQQRADQEARIVTSYFDGEGKDATPILFDAGEYHPYGTRNPRNGLYIDGTTRILTKAAPSANTN